MELPLELHLQIRNFLLADSDTTLAQLRPLRLVCKSFDSIYAPVVISHMLFFPPKFLSPPYSSLVQYVQYLVHRHKGTRSMQSPHPPSTYCIALTIKNWDFANTLIDRRSSLISHRKPILIAILHIFWNREITTTGFFSLVTFFGVGCLILAIVHVAIGPIIYFSVVSAVFLILNALYHRRSLVRFGIPRIRRNIMTVIYVPRARYHMAMLPRRLELPNVRCVRLFIHSRQCNWSIYCSTRLLLSLPQLTELELTISPDTDLNYLIKSLVQLATLRRLSLLHTRGISIPHTTCLSGLIARNEQLTHFEYDWRPDASYDLGMLFRDVPIFKPLRLLHMSLNATCTNVRALVPHIQSLTSFQFHTGENMWCRTFLKANVFPTTIKVERVDKELISFIRKHPGIVNLSIFTDTILLRLKELPLFDALSLHVSSLHRLCLNTKFLARMFSIMEFEMDFLRCGGNLRELVLLNDEKYCCWQTNTTNDDGTHNEKQILLVVSGLNRSMLVVIKSQHRIFISVLDFCRTSANPLIRDLERRLVYEKASF